MGGMVKEFLILPMILWYDIMLAGNGRSYIERVLCSATAMLSSQAPRYRVRGLAFCVSTISVVDLCVHTWCSKEPSIKWEAFIESIFAQRVLFCIVK